MVKLVEVSPQWSRVELPWDSPLVIPLRRYLSYEHPSAQWSQAAIDGRWDGTISLLYRNPKDLEYPYVPTGVLPRVREFLGGKDIESEVKLQRPDLTQGSFSIPGIFDFQKAAIEEWARSGRGIIQLPMRCGKTSYVAAGAIKLLNSIGIENILFVCQSADLLFQSMGVLQKALGKPVGIKGVGRSEIHPVTVATIQTLIKAWKQVKGKNGKTIRYDVAKPEDVQWLQGIEAVILDETHHGIADSYHTVLDRMPNSWVRLGLSGTPYSNDDGLDILIEKAIGPVLHRVTFEQMIEHDPPLLAKPTFLWYWMPKQNLQIGRYKEGDPASRYQAVYRAYVVYNEVRNGVIADFARKRAEKGESVAITVDWVEHGNEIQKLLPEAVFVDGSWDPTDRLEVWDRLRRKECRMVISTLMREALDIPSLDNTVYASAGKSIVQWPQSWRCLTSDGGRKATCRILTFMDSKEPLKRQAKERLDLCNHSGFKIQHIGRPERARRGS